jgi:hypothetical protein
MTQSKRRLLGFYAVSIALLFLVVELMSKFATSYLSGLGIFFNKAIIQQDYREYLRVRDPVLGWVTLGNAVDAFGARRDFSAYSSSRPCIDVYGDSFTWGSEVRDEDAWAGRLSDLLKCRVRNFGVAGYGSDQAYLRFLNTKQHSSVVFLDHWSDNILRNVNQFRNFLAPGPEYGFKPRFVLRGAELSLIPLPSVPEGAVQAFLDKPQRALHDEFFLPNSPWGPLIASFPYSWSLVRSYDNWMIRAKLKRQPIYAGFYSPEHPSHALALTSALLTDFYSKASAQGIRAVVILIPACRDFAEKKRLGAFPYEPLTRGLREAGVRFLDMGELIATRYHDDFRRLFVTCAGHFNAQGNQLEAEISSEYAHREKLLELETGLHKTPE